MCIQTPDKSSKADEVSLILGLTHLSGLVLLPNYVSES